LSLESDQLGYDVSAPRVVGANRLIEVKATTALHDETVSVHLSRNEAETGLRYRDWALVVCLVTDSVRREGEIVGWQMATALAPALPVDSTAGRWEVATLLMNVADLLPGLPPAVA